MEEDGDRKREPERLKRRQENRKAIEMGDRD